MEQEKRWNRKRERMRKRWNRKTDGTGKERE